MTLETLKLEFRKLPQEQRLDLLSELAEELEAAAPGPTLTPAEHAALMARLDRYRAVPAGALSLDELQQRVEAGR